MSVRNLNVGVSGLNAIDSPGPGIPVIRGLKEAKSFNARIIGFSYESLEPGIYMRDLVDKVYQIPYPSAGTEALKERLTYINNIEKLDVIIPNFDAELFSFIKLEPILKEMGISMFLPTLEQFEERHKYNLFNFGKKYNILVPYSKAIYSEADIYSLHHEFSFPLVVKGKYYDAQIAYNTDQARNIFIKIASKWGLPIIIQQYIKGTEYNVTGLGDGKGNAISAVAMKKLYITDKGKAWAGISIENEKLIEITNHFVKQTCWRGGFELEMILGTDEKYYLLEINPRIPAWIYLAIGCGHNIPEALVNLALNQKVEAFGKYDIGKMFIRYSWDMIVDINDFEKITTLGEL